MLALISIQSYGQIINVESLRKVSDTSKWTGNISLDFGLIKNTQDILKLTTGAHVQYKHKKHLILLVSDLNFQQLEGSNFVNRGVQHLRYNYKFRPRIAWEWFIQAQFDAISNIDFRGLVGTGPRFKLSTSESYKFYIGVLVMYEQEKSQEISESQVNKDFRGSTYFSFSLYPSDQVSIVSTTYYQPNLSKMSDFRVSSETSLVFRIFKDLRFASTFTLLYDAFPPTDIPQTQYEWTNGLVYTFD